MELKELSEKAKFLFGAENIETLPERILDTVQNNDEKKYEEFCNLVNIRLRNRWQELEIA